MRVAVIGGGPAGAVTAATLARLGVGVEIFEKQRFPRFHIGESLLPCNLPIYEELGISREVFADQRYMPKHAAHFEHVETGRTVRFPFADSLPGDPPSIYQVERSRFDQLLLDRAVALGATLRCPVHVERIDVATRTVHHSEGAESFDFIVDASGRETLLARQLGLLDRANDLRRAAVFGHVRGIPLAPGAQVGDISIAKGPAGWCWQIPLEADKWSVGMVLKREYIQTPAQDDRHEADPVLHVRGGTAADDLFARHIGLFPTVQARLAGQIPEPSRAIPNISYRVRDRIGPGFALLGDAGGFIDPIFSSGVLLATRAGARLGKVLAAQGPHADLGTWKQQTDHDLASFFAFIRLWYDGHFIDNLFFSDLRSEPIYRGIISLLAGNTTNPDNEFLRLLGKRMGAPVVAATSA